MTDTYDARKEWRVAFCEQITPQIVAELNKIDGNAMSWAIEPPKDDDRVYYNPAISNPSGERFWFGIDECKKRITIHSHYGLKPDGRMWTPRDYVRDADDPNPTIGADKSPAQIAKDIVRRFLPKYREYLSKYRESVSAALERERNTYAILDRMIAASNGMINRPGLREHEKFQGELTIHLHDTPAGVSYGTIRIADSWIRFDRFSVTPELAIKIATLIGGTK